MSTELIRSQSNVDTTERVLNADCDFVRRREVTREFRRHIPDLLIRQRGREGNWQSDRNDLSSTDDIVSGGAGIVGFDPAGQIARKSV